jgi:hypothetical protein
MTETSFLGGVVVVVAVAVAAEVNTDVAFAILL